MTALAWRDFSLASMAFRRRPNSMFSITFSQGKQASSWKTTPMPSGTLSPIAWPSNSISPSVGAVRPAISSSSVDFPQPDGPTTAKNSPLRISMSIGPSACTGFPPAAAGNTFVTPRSVTCAAVTRSSSGVRGALFHFLQVIRQKAGIDDLGQVDVAGQRSDAFLHLDDALHPVEVKVAVAPVRDAFGGAVDQVLDGACRHFRGDVEGLGDDLARFLGMLAHELDRAPARADHGGDKIATCRYRLGGRHADNVIEGRQRLRAGNQHAEFILDLRPERLGDRRNVDLAKLERGHHRTEAAGL